MKVERRSAEAVIVGTGPGGATVARELARAGARVLILERGRDNRRALYYGTYLGPLRYTDRRALFFSREGMHIVRPLMVGGATSMFCGSASPPPTWLAERYQLDLEPYATAAAAELQVAPLPPELRGRVSTRIAEAASDLGQEWRPQPKFMAPARSARFDCGAKCMLGCRCGAKWNAAEWIDDAVEAGAELLVETRVTQVLHTGGTVAGVRAVSSGPRRSVLEIEAPLVVVAAGGLGSPEVVRSLGFAGVGRGLAMDSTVIVYGRGPERGAGHEPPMTWSFTDVDRGIKLSTLVDPWLLYPLINALGQWNRVFTWPHWNHSYGVMIKLKDDVVGEISPSGSISKPFTRNDQLRLEHGVAIARQILTRAGADPDTIFVSPPRGTHPSATVRLGEAVNQQLETAIAGLYVCDASVFPEALGQPTVLTIIALGRRLAAHLISQRAATGASQSAASASPESSLGSPKRASR